ncbi:hypothetical protein [Candidatus Skiveiella danica]|uniref:hypothetical protein n=1 Tax=Candidatus Skiveiella danica TaxID=3386177 RepID=UPI0009CEAF4C|nr:MAG: hypothetical protein BWX79_00008 [Alphaproteobacteria bacterium ADurb.Bin100]
MTLAPTMVQMTYTHLCAWRVIGGIGMPPDSNTVALAAGEGWSYSLISDVDTACAVTDRGAALGFLVLQGIFAPAKVGSLEERLAESIQDIQETRRKKTGSYPVLFFQASGPVDVTLNNATKQRDEFVLTFDAFDKAAIRQKFVQQHRAMQLALALASKMRVRFDEATAGTYCTNTDGQTVYSLTFSGGTADLIVASPLDPDAAKTVAQRFDSLSTGTDLDSAVRLYADMAIYGREPFRAFLSGWTALEILINKTFKEHEEHFFRSLDMPHQPEMSIKFLAGVRKTMEGKHGLVDRFTLVSSVLLPTQVAEAAEADLATFKRIKKLRDEIAHGSTIDEDGLPIDELSQLLLKYLAARTERVTSAVATPASST